MLSVSNREFARELIRELKNKSLEAGTVLLKAEAVDAETERLHKDMMPYAVIITEQSASTKNVALQILKTHPARSMFRIVGITVSFDLCLFLIWLF